MSRILLSGGGLGWSFYSFEMEPISPRLDGKNRLVIGIIKRGANRHVNREAYEVVSRISDDEWRKIALELGRYALNVSRNLCWRTRNPVELPGGETVTSIVSKTDCRRPVIADVGE